MIFDIETQAPGRLSAPVFTLAGNISFHFGKLRHDFYVFRFLFYAENFIFLAKCTISLGKMHVVSAKNPQFDFRNAHFAEFQKAGPVSGLGLGMVNLEHFEILRNTLKIIRNT